MPEIGPYDDRYYESLREGGRRSAERVLPLVLELVRPASILDVGCGDGTWLAAAIRLGARDVLGVDGDWISDETLQIPRSRFRPVDLTSALDLGRRFDLALCLEVAEHLPAEAAAELVCSLASHSPVVLFSASIPSQGGEDHVNERWPSYWRGLFEMHNFACLDTVRGAIWDEESVEIWYRQNLLLFTSRAYLAIHPDFAGVRSAPLDVVHPSMFMAAVTEKAAYAQELDRLGKACLDQAAELATLQAENDRLVEARTALEQKFASPRRSLGWRLTAPLRALCRRLRV